MRIVFVPLDERPCNSKYPEMITGDYRDLEFVNLGAELLGNKKTPANIEGIWNHLNSNVQHGDSLVISMDMVLYGGLIPSRLHYLNEDDIRERLNQLRLLKNTRDIKVFASNCIMRCPTYNSSEEEPDYYEVYGKALHRKAFLEDKRDRIGLSKNEIDELSTYVIPREIIDDYESRRIFNENVNLEVLKLVKEEIIDVLVIPQDDAAQFGYTAKSQKKIIKVINELNLNDRVSIYPGADEVGCTLCAYAYNRFYSKKTKIFAFYSSTLGPTIIPLYEDRPMNETLKHHVLAINGELVYTPQEADFILAINSPGSIMQRAKEQIENQDLTYTTFRNLREFVVNIERYCSEGKRVVVCDSAYGNGGDLELLDLLDKNDLLDKITAISAWNTNANTLGTALCAGVYGCFHEKPNMYHMIYRILEDYIYQSKVRQELLNEVLPSLNCDDYEFDAQLVDVEKETEKRILSYYKKLKISNDYPIDKLRVCFPWNRVFEIDLKIRRGSLNCD